MPPEETLLRRLVMVFNLFVELPDPQRVQDKFMKPDAKFKFKNKLRYVLKGWISDPRNLAMYFEWKTLPTTKFVLYKSLRSTSQVVSLHGKHE